MKMVTAISVVIVISMFMVCNSARNVLLPFLYTPQVYFAGYINGNYDSLIGNWQYPNTCTLVKDTIRMYFYSSGFEEENKVWQGDMIRMDLLPGRDTAKGNDTAIGRARILFDMYRYHNSNETYTITPADSMGNNVVEIYVQQIERTGGGKVNIRDVSVNSAPVAGTNGQHLEIIHGRIQGTIK